MSVILAGASARPLALPRQTLAAAAREEGQQQALARRPGMSRGGGGAGGEEQEVEEGLAASEEALTADSADEEGRRGSSSSASSEAASSVSFTYTAPDDWQKVAIIKTCVSADVAAAAAPGASGGGEDDAAADRRRASGTYVASESPLPFQTCNKPAIRTNCTAEFGRDGDDEGEVLEAAAGRGHVRERQGRRHRARHLQRHHQPLRYARDPCDPLGQLRLVGVGGCPPPVAFPLSRTRNIATGS